MHATGALLCGPDPFRVATGRNPHTTNADGSLRVVDSSRASAQWRDLVKALEAINLDVQVMDATPGLPDQVFVANPVFTGWSDGPAYVASHMTYPERQGEVAPASARLEQLGYTRLEWEGEGPMEGGGDLVWFDKTIMAGHGVRSRRQNVMAAGEAFAADVVPLRLVDERYYHLDTCFCALDATRALWVPAAFDAQSRSALQRVVPQLIAVPAVDQDRLAANAWCPDGRHVLLDASWAATAALVAAEGFAAVPVDLSEFAKAGGNVFCMKTPLFGP